jgi:hypothetical protein
MNSSDESKKELGGGLTQQGHKFRKILEPKRLLA